MMRDVVNRFAGRIRGRISGVISSGGAETNLHTDTSYLNNMAIWNSVNMRTPKPQLLFLLSLTACLAPASIATAQYNPNHPVVKQMVDRGIKYLETLEKSAYEGNPASFSGQAGEAVLIAYAHHKVRHNPENPVVKAGLRVAEGIV